MLLQKKILQVLLIKVTKMLLKKTQIPQPTKMHQVPINKTQIMQLIKAHLALKKIILPLPHKKKTAQVKKIKKEFNKLKETGSIWNVVVSNLLMDFSMQF